MKLDINTGLMSHFGSGQILPHHFFYESNLLSKLLNWSYVFLKNCKNSGTVRFHTCIQTVSEFKNVAMSLRLLVACTGNAEQ